MSSALEPDDLKPQETLEELVRRIRYRLTSILRSYDIPSEDADDLLQDALLEAFRKWDKIYNKEYWLLGTLRFICSNYWKKLRLNPSEAMDLPALEGLCPPLPPPQAKREDALDLRQILKGLDPRHQRALWLRFAMGFTPHEVADQLGYSRASVRKLTLRAMSRLRRQTSSPDPPVDEEEGEVPEPELD
ncbi:MAG TPA: sigma-70 family RNA polymerase sigma factor [Thermoanaerobaculia bacterium]|nr:sigma-70 family RNA polymerase sigma factor [Thermoanaerobaculia bacterium]